jgi:hypothetical protein
VNQTIITMPDGSTTLIVVDPSGEPPAEIWTQALRAGCGHVVVLPVGRPWLVEQGVDIDAVDLLIASA